MNEPPSLKPYYMKLSFVFSTFASIVVLATAYPTQGPVAKRSNHDVVEKREDLDGDLFAYYYYDEKREENLDSGLFYYEYHDRKRDSEDLNSGLLEEGKREELNSDVLGYSGYDHLEEGKREESDSDLLYYIYDREEGKREEDDWDGLEYEYDYT